jgi:hypothetical protein
MNSVRCEASRLFRKKTRQYERHVINELATYSMKNKIRNLYKAIIIFQNGYHSRRNLVKYKKCYLLADSNKVVSRWKIVR